MILGGCGANLEQLTGLFSIFANQGLYYKPSFLQNEISPEPKRVLSASSTFMINEILSNVNRPDFPAQLAKHHTPAKNCMENRYFLWKKRCLEYWIQSSLYHRSLVREFFCTWRTGTERSQYGNTIAF